ncbi:MULTISPECIES: hypothetical protein [Chromohalobacter]|uniref:PilZ domain-containing protein n=1 Tax=Chromohalobacter beijerinckii TaxID=86179 RepID=A0ABV8XG36_9GAMM|nr:MULTISPECIES: hypothetical protein [Chromohalobacter]MCK0752578.1 hypothetical protein [Chromohalobacter japonicus]MCK0766306.1 hypothetical protein [Chromohalobacter beijerinckii]
MDSTSLFADYARWQRFQRQDQLHREHNAAVRKLAESGAMASRVAEGYRSMAEKGASEGACYRTLFLRQRPHEAWLTCEGWLFVRRVLSEGGITRVRGTLLESFTLEDGSLTPGDKPALKVTLDIYDEILVKRTMKMGCRIDRQDDDRDLHFITFLDSVRGDLRQHM